MRPLIMAESSSTRPSIDGNLFRRRNLADLCMRFKSARLLMGV